MFDSVELLNCVKVAISIDTIILLIIIACVRDFRDTLTNILEVLAVSSNLIWLFINYNNVLDTPTYRTCIFAAYCFIFLVTRYGIYRYFEIREFLS